MNVAAKLGAVEEVDIPHFEVYSGDVEWTCFDFFTSTLVKNKLKNTFT